MSGLKGLKMPKRREKTSVTKPEIRIKVRVGNGAIGPGKIRLLEQIAETGSISSAARACGMDYRRAQYLLETMAEAMGAAMVRTVVGGAQGGGAELSPEGQGLITAFRTLDTSVKQVANAQLETINKLVK